MTVQPAHRFGNEYKGLLASEWPDCSEQRCPGMVMGGPLTMSIQEALGLCGRHCRVLRPYTAALSTWPHIGLTSNCQCLHFFLYLLLLRGLPCHLDSRPEMPQNYGNLHTHNWWELVYTYPAPSPGRLDNWAMFCLGSLSVPSGIKL